MKRSAPLLCTVVLGLVAGWTRPAWAGDANEARIEYQKGNAAFERGSYTAARYHYRRALEFEETFDILCNLGRAEAELRDDRPALEHLTRCLELHPTEPALAETREKFALLRERVRTRMDAEEVAELEAELEAEKQERQLAEAYASENAPAESGTGTDEPTQESAAPAPSEPEPPPAEPRDSGDSARLPVSLAVGGVGVVGVGIGMGFFIDSSSKEDRIDELQRGQTEDACAGQSSAQCQELSELVSASDDSFNAGVVGVAAGGALLVGAVAAYLLWPEREQAAVRSQPFAFVSRDGALLGVRGSF